MVDPIRTTMSTFQGEIDIKQINITEKIPGSF